MLKHWLKSSIRENVLLYFYDKHSQQKLMDACRRVTESRDADDSTIMTKFERRTETIWLLNGTLIETKKFITHELFQSPPTGLS